MTGGGGRQEAAEAAEARWQRGVGEFCSGARGRMAAAGLRVRQRGRQAAAGRQQAAGDRVRASSGDFASCHSKSPWRATGEARKPRRAAEARPGREPLRSGSRAAHAVGGRREDAAAAARMCTQKEFYAASE